MEMEGKSVLWLLFLIATIFALIMYLVFGRHCPYKMVKICCKGKSSRGSENRSRSRTKFARQSMAENSTSSDVIFDIIDPEQLRVITIRQNGVPKIIISGLEDSVSLNDAENGAVKSISVVEEPSVIPAEKCF